MRYTQRTLHRELSLPLLWQCAWERVSFLDIWTAGRGHLSVGPVPAVESLSCPEGRSLGATHTHTQQQMSSTVYSKPDHTYNTTDMTKMHSRNPPKWIILQGASNDLSTHVHQLMLCSIISLCSYHIYYTLRTIVSMLTLNYSLHVMLSSVDIFSPISAVREAIPPNTKCLALILWTERERNFQ